MLTDNITLSSHYICPRRESSDIYVIDVGLYVIKANLIDVVVQNNGYQQVGDG